VPDVLRASSPLSLASEGQPAYGLVWLQRTGDAHGTLEGA